MATKRMLSGLVAAAAAVAALAAAVATGQSPPSGSGAAAPIRLTLLNSDGGLSGVPAVQRFVDLVRELSGGAVTIEVRPQDDGYAGYEQRVVRDVQANKAQLAWVGTRV